MKKSFLMLMSLFIFACAAFFITAPSASAFETLIPNGGTYTGFEYVQLHPGIAGDIYYTTDRTDPITSITRQVVGYHEDILVESKTTYKAVMYWDNDGEGYYGEIVSATYKIKPFTSPKLKPAANNSLSYPKLVTITNIPPDCKAYYTVDGSDPTTNPAAVLYDGSPITVGSSITVKASFNKTCTCGYLGEIIETRWGPVTTATY